MPVTMKGTTMAVVTTRQLLESGVHFGHQTRRWNPKMKRFIFNERNGIYIIDLRQSLTYIDKAYAFVKDTVAKGGQVLFVGTKKQAQEAVVEQASRVGMPYVDPVSYTHLDVYKRQDEHLGGTIEHDAATTAHREDRGHDGRDADGGDEPVDADATEPGLARPALLMPAHGHILGRSALPWPGPAHRPGNPLALSLIHI